MHTASDLYFLNFCKVIPDDGLLNCNM